MITWPVRLPRPQIAGNTRGIIDLSVRSDIPNGLPRARRRFSHARATAPITLICTDEQLALFDGWWHYTLGHGCAWFLVTLAGETGQAAHAARITSAWTAELVGIGSWRVSASLELDNPPHQAAA